MTAARKTGALRSIREEQLGGNPVIVATTRELLQAKVARLKALENLDQLNEQKASRSVWVPPSSSRGSKHGTRATVDDLDSKLRATKANARLQAGEVRRLSLKRAFVLWRQVAALRVQMDQALDRMEENDRFEVMRLTFSTWVDVAEPWVYEESVLESAELFRLVSQLGRQDRIMNYWRVLVARTNELEARREVFEEHMGRRLIQDAMVHWKVYRLVYHLKRSRENMASNFDRLRRLRAVFVHLRDRARRRVCICERMEAAVFQDRKSQPTVDDLLTMGQHLMMVKEPYVVMDEHLRVTMDIQAKKAMMQQLKAASNEMRALVRWNDVAVHTAGDIACGSIHEGNELRDQMDSTGTIETKEDGDVACSDEPLPEAKDPMEPIRERIAFCSAREDTLRLEQQVILAEMTKLSGSKLPRLQEKQQKAMGNLSECEMVMSDLEAVRRQLERRLLAAADAVSKRKASHAEATAIIEHLVEARSVALTAVDSSKALLVSHVEECERLDEKIVHWKAKVDDHARQASATAKWSGSGEKGRGLHGKHGRDITAAVKLDEARDRLQRAEARRLQLDALRDQLVTAQEEAMAKERRAQDELSRAREAEENAKIELSEAEDKYNSLVEYDVELEGDYNGLMPCLEKLLSTVDQSDAAVAATLERISELDSKYESLEESLRGLHEERRRLEQEVEAYVQLKADEEAMADRLVPSLHDDAEQSDTKEEAVSVSLWGNVSNDDRLFGTTRRRGRHMIPGDRLVLQAADSYRILSRARSCMAHWRSFTSQKRTARQTAERLFIDQVAPRALAAWQLQVHEEAEAREAWNDRRVLASAMSAWRRTSHKLRRDAFLVESCRAVRAAKVQERVLLAWKEVAEEELVCLHAMNRRGIALRANVFVYWRNKTSRSVDLAVRLAPVQQRKDMLLTKNTFDEWRQATKKRLALRMLVERACEEWSLRIARDAYFETSNGALVLADCINAWSLAVHQAREDRRLNAIKEVIQTSRRKHMLRYNFHGLIKAVETQRNALNATLRHAEERHRLTTLHNAFAYLRSWASHRAIKAAHLRIKWSYDYPLRTAIIAWQTAIDRRQEMEDRKLLCNRLRRAIPGDCHFESPAGLKTCAPVGETVVETSSQIKSATYLAADLTPISFADSAHGASPSVATEHDGAQATAISL